MSGEYPDLVNRVEAQGFSVIKTSPCAGLPFYERYHADMQCINFDGNHLIVLKNCIELQEKLKNRHINFELSYKKAAPKYPDSILLNCAILGAHVFCNQKSIDPLITQYCKRTNKNMIQVAQGYAKCSTAVVAPKALITADPSIYHAAANSGLDVLKIRQGHISLPGYPYGFIGGCCALLAKDHLAFTGKIQKHPDYEKMKSFALNHGVYLHSLYNEPLIDIGGLVMV